MHDIALIRAAYDREYTRFYDRPVPGSDVGAGASPPPSIGVASVVFARTSLPQFRAGKYPAVTQQQAFR